MGFLSFLFPSADDKLAKARRLIEAGRASEARDLALDLGDHAGAAQVLDQAERALAQKNLDASVSWAEAGDAERVTIHMELAEGFRKAGMDDAFKSARRRIREIRQGYENEAKQAARKEMESLLEVSPAFKARHSEPELPLPEGVSEDQADALRTRLALIHESYPEALRGRMFELPPSFAEAVLALEEGQFEVALKLLMELDSNEPLVLHELARTALALGDVKAAARTWMAFAVQAGGHYEIGAQHTAVNLAQCHAQLGQLDQGIAVLTKARETDPHLGGMLLASMLEATGDLPQAESVLTGLTKRHGHQGDIALLLARVRHRAGHRIAAMQTLETSLGESQCTPGKCGYRPPHLGVHRMLALMYLEDGKDVPRGLELADIARSVTKKPTWEDMYLATLAAFRRGDTEAQTMIQRLWDGTPDGDGRRTHLAKFLPVGA